VFFLELISCNTCGKKIKKTCWNKKYCQDCRKKQNRHSIGQCSCCGKIRTIKAFDLCFACYSRKIYRERKEKRGQKVIKKWEIRSCKVCGTDISRKHSNRELCDICQTKHFIELGTRLFSPHLYKKYDYDYQIGIPDFTIEARIVKKELRQIGIIEIW